MPDPAPPVDFLEKRRILYGKGTERRRADMAARLIEAGRLAEALEYLDRQRDPALLDRVRRAATGAGDAFALNRAGQLLKTEPDPSEWRDLARQAEGRGRWFDCVNALRRAGDDERAEEIRKEHCPGFEPFRPAGK